MGGPPEGVKDREHLLDCLVTQMVERPTMVREAWQESHAPMKCSAPGAEVRDYSPAVPCLALRTEDGIHFTANMLTKKGISKEKRITRGSHAFVKVAQLLLDQKFRVYELTFFVGQG